MVWAFGYEPSGSSSPKGAILEGFAGQPEMVDPSHDGGVGFSAGNRTNSGRRLKPETLPKILQWQSKRKFQDLEGLYVYTVSDRLLDLIEEVEPNIHQFEPIKFVAKDGTDLGTRWFWQICNRLDTVNREHTRWVLKNGLQWRPPDGYTSLDKYYPVFDTKAIGATKFWNDKHDGGGSYCSDEAREMIDEHEMTGFRFSYREQI